MLDYKSSAEQILDLVGGKTNITQFAHCSTRLRFTLKDNSKANLDALKKVPGVMGVVLKGQLQVIIGNNVVEMYEALQKAGQLEGAGHRPGRRCTCPQKEGQRPCARFPDWHFPAADRRDYRRRPDQDPASPC